MTKSLAQQIIEKCIAEQSETLDLGQCGLTDNSAELALLENCSWVKKLILSNNREYFETKHTQNNGEHNDFTQIPATLPLSLIELDCKRVGLEVISQIAGLTKLEELNLNDNLITKMEGLDTLTNISSLDLNNNQITKMEGLDKLSNISSLDLQYNKITKIEGLDTLTNISSLYLSGNQITKIEGLDTLTNISSLALHSNKITKIEGLDTLTNISSLDLQYNKIIKIEGLDTLTNISSLDLQYNKITKIEGLDKLTNISSLSLHENKITKIEGLDTLTNISSLYLQYNQITKIEGLGTLTNISSLKLNNNQITKIEGLDKLSNISSLELYNNPITKIEGLDTLTNIASLDLYNNLITTIEGLENLGQLDKLDLRDNPISNFPQALVAIENCYPHYQAWQKELENGVPFENNQSKILLLGNGNVGKSSLLDALKYGKSSPRAKEDSTHGIVLDEWEHTDLKHRYQVWDFGGQELFFGTHRLFMKGQSIILLVFDTETQEQLQMPDRINTEEYNRNKNIKQWIAIAQEESPESPILVVQTKKASDATDKAIQAYCANEEIPFLHIDSHTGTDMDLVTFYIQKLTKEQLWEYKMLMPSSWNNLRNYFLSEQRKEKPEEFSIDKTALHRLCSEYGISEYAWDAVLTYLHNSGIVYSNPPYLGDTIIYDLRWVLKAIYQPLDRASNFYTILRKYAQGFIAYNELVTEWQQSYVPNQIAVFFNFMQSCGICFRLNKEYQKIQPDDYLVFPEFLNTTKPPAIIAEIKALHPELEQIEITLNYLPTYIVQNYIRQYGQYTDKAYYWYNGILVLNKEFVCIEADFTSNRLVFYFKKDASASWRKEILKHLPSELIKEKELEKYWQPLGKVPATTTEQVSTTLTPIKNIAPLRIAISYAAQDSKECKNLVNRLKTLGADNKVKLFYDANIDENDWDKKIREDFKKADLIIVLNSECYNFKEKKYIWEVEMPIIEAKLKEEGKLSVLRININTCITRGCIGSINDFKKRNVPMHRNAKAAFYTDIINNIILEKIIKPSN
jgi:Leucine-rich repeat (LRR) protein